MLRRHQQLAIAGSLHFVTTVTKERGNWFVEERICRKVLEIFESYREKFDVPCLGYVLMPDHFHAVLCQANDGEAVSEAMQAFKRLTSEECRPLGYTNRSLWRRRYDDVPLPGPKAATARLKYVHENPLRQRMVDCIEDYAWSSARDYAETEEGIIRIAKELLSPGT